MNLPLTKSRHEAALAWLFGSVFLGSLPWGVNLTVQFITANISFYSVFRIPDLMCFVIILSATTMLDLTRDRSAKYSGWSPLVWAILIVFIVLAALLLGISSFDSTLPPATGPYKSHYFRLVMVGTVLSTSALICTIWFHLWLPAARPAVAQTERDIAAAR